MAQTTVARQDDAIIGTFDGIEPEINIGRVAGIPILIAGKTARVRGWAFDPGGKRLTTDVYAGNTPHPIRHGQARVDVASTYGKRRGFAGFDGSIEIAPDAPAGELEFRAEVRPAGGEPFELEPIALGIVAARPETPVPVEIPAAALMGRFRFVRDTRANPYPFGWSGRQTIRPFAVLHAEGWVAGSNGAAPDSVWVQVEGNGVRALYATEPIPDGEATGSTGDAAACGFRLVADTRALGPGLYDLTVVAKFPDGTKRGPAALFQVAPRLPDPGPLFLPVAYQQAANAIERVEPADVLRGGAIAIAGWAIDPATERGSDVFLAFDANQPLPLASFLPRPDVRPEGDAAIGFSGIGDTTDLRPGTHVLKVLMLDAAGAAWYELGRREIIVRPGL